MTSSVSSIHVQYNTVNNNNYNFNNNNGQHIIIIIIITEYYQLLEHEKLSTERHISKKKQISTSQHLGLILFLLFSND